MNRRHLLFCASCFLLGVAGCATTAPPASRECFHLRESVEDDIGYCQAIRQGNTLYISGTAGQGEMPTAIHSVYDRLQRTLEAHGLTFKNVVRENVFSTNLDVFIENKDLRKPYYGDTYPAATWVQVQRLYVPSLVVEVELTAVFPPTKR
jgi:enamine deaminase RidA (YjgF/YER057c/UK114 family)